MTDDLGLRLTERMTKSERDQTHPNVEPRDAATLMLIDRSGATPKVLLGRRHHGHKFMPGKFVFPGGRLEPHDAEMSRISDLHPDIQAKLNTRVASPSADFARALALTAIRETAEETGLLLGVRRDAPPATPGEIWAEFAKAKVHPDLGQIHFIARAITPPGRPKRFDTRFFTADASAIAHRVDGVIHPDAELVELVWVELGSKPLADLHAMTKNVLGELEKRLATGPLRHDAPVPFFHFYDGKMQKDVLGA